MAWIESHQELRLHPKVRRLAIQLEVELAQAIGHLHCLWWWALDYASDGDLGRYLDEEIAAACEWSGDAGRLVEALAACHFLEGEPGRYEIHDWQQYGGRYLKKRTADKERQRRLRERRSLEEAVTREPGVSHGAVTRDACVCHTPTNQTNKPDQPEQPDQIYPSDADAPDACPSPPPALVAEALPFEAFWDLYPKATEKRRARTTWARLSQPHREDALAGARVVAAAVAGGAVAVQFVPGAAVFLHGQRWEEWQGGVPAHYGLASGAGGNGRGATLTAEEIYRLTREESR